MNSYICLDIEATGLSPRIDKIIEIGAIKVIDGVETDTFSTFVNPGRKLDERIVELTGITDDDLKDAPFIDTVIPEFVEFCGDLPLLGHHIISDFSILKQAAMNNRLTFEKEAVDTLKISRACFPALPSKKLIDMCAHYDIPLEAHRALNDAKGTDALYRRLREEFSEKYPELFVPAELIHNVKKERPIRKNQKERIQAMIERYGIECPYDLEHMSMNEAGRYIDKLIATYGK